MIAGPIAANGDASFVHGISTTTSTYKLAADGVAGVALGINSYSQSYAEFVAGTCNQINDPTPADGTTTENPIFNPNSYDSSDPAFMVGIGFVDPIDGCQTRANALTVMKNGNVYISGRLCYGSTNADPWTGTCNEWPPAGKRGLDSISDEEAQERFRMVTQLQDEVEQLEEEMMNEIEMLKAERTELLAQLQGLLPAVLQQRTSNSTASSALVSKSTFDEEGLRNLIQQLSFNK